ncbi:MAG: glutamate--cysteine ligase, partial [Thermodesulfobacteriota bacterium]
ARERASVKTADLLRKISRQYSERNIDYSPSIFVKSNSGTYGMAVISVDDPEKIKNLNSKNRKRMKVSKGGIVVRDLVIQEGIPTSLIMNEGSAEPVIYLVDGKVAGMFYRVNREKDIYSNLNSSGMEFVKYNHLKENGIPDIFSLISQTATVAAGYEIEKVIKEGGCKEEAV